MKKIIAIAVVLAMCILPAWAILQDESAAVTENVTIRPESNYVVWVSTDPVPYQGMYGNALNFTSDPYNDVVRYVNMEITLADLKTSDGYTSSPVWNEPYYVVCLDGNENESINIRIVPVADNPLIFLDKGEYTFNIVSTNCSYVSVSDNGRNHESTNIKDGKGTIEIELSKTAALSVSGNYGGGEYVPWTEVYITYNIDPTPTSRPDVSSYNGTVTIQTDLGVWHKYTTNETITGQVHCSSWWGSTGMYIFEEGSAEEAAFVETVVNANLTKASTPMPEYVTISGKHAAIYTCYSGSRSEVSLGVRDSPSDPYEYRYYKVSDQIVSSFDTTPYRFYSTSDFKIGVKYDPSQVKYVALKYSDPYDSKPYIPLQSGKLYDLEWETAGEYELVAIMYDDCTSMAPLEIEIYTENVAQADDFGMVFAAVAIILCVIAFGILFISGRRPKWKEDAGLTESEEE